MDYVPRLTQKLEDLVFLVIMKFQRDFMPLRSEEGSVFFEEDEEFTAFTIHLKEINVRDMVLMNKLLEGDRLDGNRFSPPHDTSV
jgi:hypothetical protein